MRWTAGAATEWVSVQWQLDDGIVRAEGPKGKLAQPIPAGITAAVNNKQLQLRAEGLSLL